MQRPKSSRDPQGLTRLRTPAQNRPWLLPILVLKNRYNAAVAAGPATFRVSIMGQYFPLRHRVLLVSLALFAVPGSVQSQEAVPLVERFVPGYEYRVTTRVELKGELSIPM